MPPLALAHTVPDEPLTGVGHVRVLAVIGTVLALIGTFLPWYSVTVEVKDGPFQTDGKEELVTVDGLRGVQVSELVENESDSKELFNLPIPFGVFVLIGVVHGFMAASEKYNRSRISKYLVRGGIANLLVGIVTVIIISQAASFLPGSTPEDVKVMVGEIQANPLGGDLEDNYSDWGNVSVTWGVGQGLILLTVGGLCKLMGGIFVKGDPKEKRRDAWETELSRQFDDE
jgi:hypothetical protein